MVSSQSPKRIYLSAVANMEAVMYAEVLFIDQIHDSNAVKSPINVFSSIFRAR